MTDKTDIAALRAETWNLCTMQDSMDFVEKLLGKLEAERQQREVAEAASLAMRDDMHVAREELAELRGEQEPVLDIIRDANRYRFLRDEDSWGEDSDSWDFETKTGLISSQNLMGGLSPEMFDAAVDARLEASDIPFHNPAVYSINPVAYAPKGHVKRYLSGGNSGCWVYGQKTNDDDEALFLGLGKGVDEINLPGPYFGDRNCLDKREVVAALEAAGIVVKDGE